MLLALFEVPNLLDIVLWFDLGRFISNDKERSGGGLF
jgi:hypothetical protein